MNGKAKNYRVALWVLVGVHLAVSIVKMVYMGWFSGLADLVAITVLVIAIVRFDYCQLMIYIVLNLAEAVALIIVLGFYF